MTYFNYGKKNGDANVKQNKNGPSLWEDGYNPIVATGEEKEKKEGKLLESASRSQRTLGVSHISLRVFAT